MQTPNRNFQKALTAAYTLLGSLLVFVGIGYYLSHRYDNIMWLAGMLVVGVIVGMYELYKQIK